MNNNPNTQFFVQYRDLPERKHGNRAFRRSITWTEKEALKDTECCHPDCSKPVSERDAPIPLCDRHTAEVLFWSVRAIRAEVDDATAVLSSLPVMDPTPQPGQVVYYARSEGTVKIGTTTDLVKRMRQLKCDLLAHEPGGYDIESTRHREYGFARSHLEFFHPAPELVEWIKFLRGEVKATA